MAEQHNPRISIIVPAYNIENYIEQCLDSIVHQPFRDIEIICVEDCSTDNTLSVLEFFADKDTRIKVITHDKNKGLSAARNTGIDASAGTYILYLDSDDYLLPDALQRMWEAVQENNLDLLTFCRENFQSDDWSGYVILPTKYRTVSVGSIMTGPELMDLQIRHGEFNPVVWPNWCAEIF